MNDIGAYRPVGVMGIMSGGTKGVGTCARKYALASDIKLTEFVPGYERYGQAELLERNEHIVDYADLVMAIGDGSSSGMKYAVDRCRRRGTTLAIVEIEGVLQHEGTDFL